MIINIKHAKRDDIPLLKADGENFQKWKASFLSFYSGQLDNIMRLALNERIDAGEEEKKRVATLILRSLTPELREVYVLQPTRLKDGYNLYEELVLRFGNPDQAEEDVNKFFSMKQKGQSLFEFLTEYSNLYQKRSEAITKFYSDEKLMRHLFKSLNESSRSAFPHSAKSFEEALRILTMHARLMKKTDATALAIQKKKRCFNCGSPDHMKPNCPNGIKCFGCNKYGHISKDCPLNQ